MNEPYRGPDRRPVPRDESESWQPRQWTDTGGQLPALPVPPPRPPALAPEPAPKPAHQQPPDADAARVRPFIVTGGRTRPLRDGLRIESLVLATERASTVPLRFEQRRLVELAQRSVSLAELAARLAVPIGVARVLVSDLHQEELIKIVEPHELPRDVIERIRDLVKAL